MVFVEYESEVEEERARVIALLEKLRIEAEVLVFWLASGELNSYELIINGVSNDMDYEIVVNDALRDEEWWDELQTYRGQSGHMSSSQEQSHIANILDSTSGRPGAFNPHEEGAADRRRTSITEFSDMPKKPDIAILSKLGVSMGIHTHHLHEEVFEESASDVTDSEAETSEHDDYPWDEFAQFDGVSNDNTKEPLLQEGLRRRGRKHKKNDSGASSRSGNSQQDVFNTQPGASYGTMSSTLTMQPEVPTLPRAVDRIPEIAELGSSPSPKNKMDPYTPPKKKEPFPDLEPPQMPGITPRRARSVSPTRLPAGSKSPRSGAATPSRPGMSRQSSAVKFSSRPVPETTISGEDSKMGFAPQTSTPTTPAMERPPHSRQSSLGKFSSRPSAEPRFNNGEGPSSKTISFAEKPVYVSHSASNSAAHSRHHSRQNSQYSTIGTAGDVRVSIPELVSSYKEGDGDGTVKSPTDQGSSYSTQSVALSFNDLPSRAQHVILNELMKQNSNNTAVLLSTLPIPSEGTCTDEEATVQYLSDVEVLCNELPPTLMVLSNNMTVTVSL